MCGIVREASGFRESVKARTQCQFVHSVSEHGVRWADTEKTTQPKKKLSGIVKKFSVFEDLPEEDLRWLAERMDELTLAPGEPNTQTRRFVDYLVRCWKAKSSFRLLNSSCSPVFVAVAGEITARLPFSSFRISKERVARYAYANDSPPIVNISRNLSRACLF